MENNAKGRAEASKNMYIPSAPNLFNLCNGVDHHTYSAYDSWNGQFQEASDPMRHQRCRHFDVRWSASCGRTTFLDEVRWIEVQSSHLFYATLGMVYVSEWRSSGIALRYDTGLAEERGRCEHARPCLECKYPQER